MFLVVVVGVTGAIVDAAQPIDRCGLVEEGVGERGLAAGAMPDECNRADVARVVLQHGGEAPSVQLLVMSGMWRVFSPKVACASSRITNH